MATSRTGTAQYKRWRHAVLARGKRDGVTHCPLCRAPLDYRRGKRPNSAEPDHLVPWALGGTNTVDNGRVLCRRCNQRRGDGTRGREPRPRPAITNLVTW